MFKNRFKIIDFGTNHCVTYFYSGSRIIIVNTFLAYSIGGYFGIKIDD